MGADGGVMAEETKMLAENGLKHISEDDLTEYMRTSVARARVARTDEYLRVLGLVLYTNDFLFEFVCTVLNVSAKILFMVIIGVLGCRFESLHQVQDLGDEVFQNAFPRMRIAEAVKPIHDSPERPRLDGRPHLVLQKQL